MDVCIHYLQDDSRYDYEFREGALGSALAAILGSYLKDMEAPKEVLIEYLLKPYEKLVAELKEND